MRPLLRFAAALLAGSTMLACQGAGPGVPTAAPTLRGLPTTPGLQPTSSGLQPPPSVAPSGAGGGSLQPPGTPRPSKTPRPSGAPHKTVAPHAITPFHAATDLERVIPTQAGGQTLTVESVLGTGFVDNKKHKAGLRCRWYLDQGLRCRDVKQLAAVLSMVGKSPADVSIAVGYNETKNKEIEVQATRVSGVSGAQLLDAVLAVLRDDAAKHKRTLNVATASGGGKAVTVITYTFRYPLGLKRYFYASADTLFDIRRADVDPATEILTALP
jgi:hypothetical protein